MTQAIYGSNYEYGLSPVYKDDEIPPGPTPPVPPPTPITCNDGTIITPTKVLDIIRRALRLLGVLVTNETVDGPEAADCLEQLNWMVDSWANEKLLCFVIDNEIFNLNGGQGHYTIGPDATKDFNAYLPLHIESAFVRDTTSGYQNDYKLDIIPNAKWQDVFQKGIGSTYPRWLCFHRTWPYGSIDIWPVPTRSLQLSLSVWHQVQKWLRLSDIVCLPPGYKTALAYNLAIAMAGEYGQSINPIISNEAKRTKAVIKTINQEQILMSTDAYVLPRRAFNLLSGLYST